MDSDPRWEASCTTASPSCMEYWGAQYLSSHFHQISGHKDPLKSHKLWCSCYDGTFVSWSLSYELVGFFLQCRKQKVCISPMSWSPATLRIFYFYKSCAPRVVNNMPFQGRLWWWHLKNPVRNQPLLLRSSSPGLFDANMKQEAGDTSEQRDEEAALMWN